MKKYENLNMDFSKKGPKMSMGRVPIEIFGVSKFFYRNFVKKNLSRSGTPKIDDFRPFFRNRSSKFLPSGKKGVF